MNRVGDTLDCSTGTWTGPPDSYTYQWQRSPDGVTWANIAGATSTSYTLTDADRTRYIRCLVTAKNLAAAAAAPSNVLGPIVAAVRPWSQATNTLGCGVYDVIVLERGGGRILASFPWTQLDWERVLDDTSAGNVVADGYPDDCCATLAPIRPWRHELAIYRDGAEVWVGPIQVPQAPADKYAIAARDLTAWWDHRLIHLDHHYTAADLASIFNDLSDDAMSVDDSPGLTVAASPCGVTASMDLLATQHLMAGPQIRDISNTGIDWTAIGRSVIAGGLVVPTEPIGTFEDAHFASTPTTRYDGSAQANTWLVRGNGGGAAGDTVYGAASDSDAGILDGVLESVATISTIEDNASAQAAAMSRVALTTTPVIVENCVLSPDAPFTIDQLVPGALCHLLLSETCIPVDSPYRLQKVSARAQDEGEQISLVFQPVGTETSP